MEAITARVEAAANLIDEISAAERRIQRDLAGLTHYAEHVFRKVWKTRAELYATICEQEIRKVELHAVDDAELIERINEYLSLKYIELSTWDDFVGRLSKRCGEVDNIVNELVEITHTEFEEDDYTSDSSEDLNS